MATFKLSDRDALHLSQLLVKYFADCVAEDPGSTHPGNLSVRELIEDLAGSTEGDVQSAIEENLDAILDLYM